MKGTTINLLCCQIGEMYYVSPELATSKKILSGNDVSALAMQTKEFYNQNKQLYQAKKFKPVPGVPAILKNVTGVKYMNSKAFEELDDKIKHYFSN